MVLILNITQHELKRCDKDIIQSGEGGSSYQLLCTNFVLTLILSWTYKHILSFITKAQVNVFQLSIWLCFGDKGNSAPLFMASYFSTIAPFREIKGTFVSLIPSNNILKS